MKVLLNNRLLPASRARVSVFDHSFLYGDGIYETVRVYNGRVFCWPAHYRRLKASCRALALACPWRSGDLEARIRRLVRANGEPSATVRITISRGEGPLGYDPAHCPIPTLAMMLHPARSFERIRQKGARVVIARVRRTPPECLDPRIKSNNALPLVLAKVEAKRRGAFEAVLLNGKGELAEGTLSNLFWIKGGVLFTPALACGILEGVTRGEVLRLARRDGLRVREGRFPRSALRRADEIFLTSTTLEIVPVVAVVAPGRLWSGRPGPLTRRLQALYQAAVEHETGVI